MAVHRHHARRGSHYRHPVVVVSDPYAGPTSCGLRPDTDIAWRWLTWWFKECTQGLLEIGYMVPATGQLTKFSRWELESEAVLYAVQKINEVPGQNLYIRAATISPDANKAGATDKNVLQAPGVWADLDTPEQVERARNVTSMIRANGWVTTGRVPHARFQLYFRSAEPLTNPDTIRQFNRRLQSLYGGDPAVVNPSRLMRMPGSIAWPYKAGRVPELTSFDEAGDDRPKVYPISTLASQLPQIEDTPIFVEGPSFGIPGTVSHLIAEIRSGRHWHNNMIRLVAHWVAGGRTTAEILLAAESLTIAPYTASQTIAEVRKAIDGARTKWGHPDTDPLIEPEPDTNDTYAAISFDPSKLSGMAPYDWVYGNVMVSKYFCALGAPPGTGKSALIVVMALSIVTGRALLGGDPPLPGNAWIINLEDPAESVWKMVWAACQYYEIDLNYLKDKLFINSGRDKGLVVAKLVNGAVLRMPVVPNLTAECQRHNIRALFVDPVVDTHNLPENDNITMNEYCAIWNQLADQANLAVLLSMHFRKGGQGGDPDAFRGATAIIGKARSAVTLAVMSEQEAEKLKIPQDQRRFHLRMDNAKRNLSPPPTKADWLRLESIEILIGDNIQTLREWTPPSPWEGLTGAQTVTALEQIDRGLPSGEFYTKARRGKASHRWVGNAILANAIKDSMTADQAGIIVNQWLQSDVLVDGVYLSPERREPIACVRVDMGKLAEIRANVIMPAEPPWGQ